MTLVSYTLEGAIAVLQMDDKKANALSHAMIEALDESLTRAEKEASAVVLAGRPERFSAGFDLKVLSSGPEAAEKLLAAGGRLFMRLYGFPLPVVAACTGHAIAGGALTLLCSDMRIGTAGAYRIGLNELSIGMTLPILALELARDRLAPAELGQATLRGTMYDPEGAARVGYLDAVVPAGDLLARAKDEAGKLGAFARKAFHGTKQRLRGKTIAHILATMDEDTRSLLA